MSGELDSLSIQTVEAFPPFVFGLDQDDMEDRLFSDVDTDEFVSGNDVAVFSDEILESLFNFMSEGNCLEIMIEALSKWNDEEGTLAISPHPSNFWTVLSECKISFRKVWLMTVGMIRCTIKSGKDKIHALKSGLVFLYMAGIPGNQNFINDMVLQEVLSAFESTFQKFDQIRDYSNNSKKKKLKHSQLDDCLVTLLQRFIITTRKLVLQLDMEALNSDVIFKNCVLSISGLLAIPEIPQTSLRSCWSSCLFQIVTSVKIYSSVTNVNIWFKQILLTVFSICNSKHLSSKQKDLASNALQDLFHLVYVFFESVSPNPLASPLEIFVQHMCLHHTTNADSRKFIRDLTINLLLMSNSLTLSFGTFFLKLSKNSKISVRITAVELVEEYLEKVDSKHQSDSSVELGLFETLISRSSDCSPKVRSKALSAISNYLIRSISSSNIMQHRNLDWFHEKLMPLSMLRLEDSYSAVRKAALQTLSALLLSPSVCISPSKENVQMICNLSNDSSVTIRKQVVLTITNLCKLQQQKELDWGINIFQYWLEAVVPLIKDQEISVKQKVVDSVNDLIIEQVTHRRAADSIFDYLDFLSHESFELDDCLEEIFDQLSQSGRISVAFCDKINGLLSAENYCLGYYRILKVIASVNPSRIDSYGVLNVWKSSVSENLKINAHLMRTLSYLSNQFDEFELIEMEQQIFAYIMSDSLSIGNCKSALLSLYSILEYRNNFDLKEELFSSSCEFLRLISSQYAENLLCEETNLDKIIRNCFIIGELNLLQSYVDFRSLEVILNLYEKSKESQNNLDFSLKVRVHSLLALGKICLTNESTARSYIRIFMEELQNERACPVIRNNVLMILADICRLYTSVVDHHVSSISLRLVDKSPVIRRHTMIILTQLLQEEFIKCKGTLLMRIISRVIDDDEFVRALADACINDILVAKYPTLFTSYFIDAIFYFNMCTGNSAHNQFVTTSEDSLFALTSSRDERNQKFIIYRKFLEKMTPEQRFSICSKISSDVLGGFVDGTIDLTSVNQELLRDCFDILSMKEMSGENIASTTSEEMDETDEGVKHNAAIIAVRKSVLSELEKRNAFQNTIPTLLSLKKILEDGKSPCLKYLITHLKHLFNIYRNDMADVFGVGTKLVKEMEYDIEAFERQTKAKLQQAELRRLSFSSLVNQDTTLPEGYSSIPHGYQTPIQTPKSKSLVKKTPGSSSLKTPSLKLTQSLTQSNL